MGIGTIIFTIWKWATIANIFMAAAMLVDSFVVLFIKVKSRGLVRRKNSCKSDKKDTTYTVAVAILQILFISILPVVHLYTFVKMVVCYFQKIDEITNRVCDESYTEAI